MPCHEFWHFYLLLLNVFNLKWWSFLYCFRGNPEISQTPLCMSGCQFLQSQLFGTPDAVLTAWLWGTLLISKSAVTEWWNPAASSNTFTSLALDVWRDNKHNQSVASTNVLFWIKQYSCVVRCSELLYIRMDGVQKYSTAVTKTADSKRGLMNKPGSPHPPPCHNRTTTKVAHEPHGIPQVAPISVASPWNTRTFTKHNLHVFISS